jgi:hypothetical protein
MVSGLRAALLAAALAVGLTACAPAQGGEPDMDQAALEASFTAIDGVTRAEASGYNTGAPGSYGVRVALTVDETGLASIGDVMTEAVDAAAAHAPGFKNYVFEVIAPDPAYPDEEVIITLADYRPQIPLPVGSYSGSTLTLTADELATASTR